MANIKLNAGFDISKSFFDVAAPIEGKLVVKRFTNDVTGFKALKNWLPEGIKCVMEATGPYYLRLACYLDQQGILVIVVNPLVIKRFCQMRMLRAKTDQVDARAIAAYADREDPARWIPPKPYVIKLQQMDNLIALLQKQVNALGNELEAFTVSGMIDKDVRKTLLSEIKQKNTHIAKLEDLMHQTVRMYHQEMLEQLSSIPGIGKKSAMLLITITEGFNKFENVKQLSSYIGICPRIYQSGSSVRGKGRICKMGISRVRAILYICSWSAIKYNQACKELYQRLLEKGKSKKLALIAVVNKLIRQAFAIATRKVYYQKNSLSITCN